MKFAEKSSNDLLAFNYQSLFSICDTNEATDYINDIASINRTIVRNPMDNSIIRDNNFQKVVEKQSTLLGLCSSIKTSLESTTTIFGLLDDDIQVEYNNWEGKQMTQVQYDRAFSRLFQVQKAHGKIKNTFTNAMNKIIGKIDNFRTETSALYDVFSQQFIKPSKKFSGHAKTFAKTQDALITGLEAVKKSITNYCSHRQYWAKLLMGFNVRIVS